jgi:hypothetical protein
VVWTEANSDIAFVGYVEACRVFKNAPQETFDITFVTVYYWKLNHEHVRPRVRTFMTMKGRLYINSG